MDTAIHQNAEKESFNKEQVTVLVTKKMTIAQQELLLNAHLSFVSFSFIQKEKSFLYSPIVAENIIVTSQYAASILIEEIPIKELNKKTVFCVGNKSKLLFEKKGIQVRYVAKAAKELAVFIIEYCKNEQFHFFCGNKRRDELPQLLKQYDVDFEETEIYKTYLRSKKIERTFDGILFFSPSGVDSFLEQNLIGESVAFCIGETTARTARKHTNKVVVATTPTIENVIVQAIKHFKN